VLTAEQQKALTTRDVPVALSAGAGCGKTHVLTQRFLSHLEPNGKKGERAELRQLIAITFTDAAAREMRTRIREGCRARLQDADLGDKETDKWVQLLRVIETARISTIHSFCASLLRQHAVAARLDPAFGVLEQVDADVVMSEAMDDVLRQRLAERDDLTLDLASAFGLARLKQQLQIFLTRGRSTDRDNWLAKSPSDVVNKWRDVYAREAWPAAMREIAVQAPVTELMRLIEVATPRNDNRNFEDAIAMLRPLLRKLADEYITPDDLQAICRNARVRTAESRVLCSAKDWPTKDDYEHYRESCVELRDLIERHTPKPFDEEAAMETARLGLDLLKLSDVVAAAYVARKATLGKLDFDDLLGKAHSLLANPENTQLLRQLSDDLRLVLVDEFQDTDRLQVELIKKLCGKGFKTGRLFFVGDFKQSIYRFRGAEPREFHALRQQVPESGRLRLTENFRSQPAILHFANALFEKPFSEEYDALRPKRDQKTAEPSVEFLWTIVPAKNSRGKGMAESARRKEALSIARRLRELIDGSSGERPIVDEQGEPRRLQASDVAILFRALSDVQIYEEALRAYDLEYYLVGGHAFYAQQEIFDVLNLLRAVASPADELSLAGVLRSPFFSLEDETLFWLAEAGKVLAADSSSAANGPSRLTSGLNAGLLSERLPDELTEVERAKVVRAADTIRHLRSIKDHVSIAALLDKALSLTGYDAILLAEFLGPRKLANLQKLMERARTADQGGTLELDGFITQLAQFTAEQPKEALAATAAETANVIRLMTIHQAKGLQFPFVIVPDLDRPLRHWPPAAALDGELGPLVPYPHDDDKEPATGMTLFAARERVAELEERKRLLYVACTRAADYLMLSSSLERCDAPKSDWMQLVAASFDLATGELLRTLPPDYKTPRVRVTLDEPADGEAQVGKSRGPDLEKMIADAREAAAAGRAADVRHVGPIPVDRAARRQFSFSRLTGQLTRFDPAQSLRSDGVDAPDWALSRPALDAREFGTLVHDVLARVRFGKPNSTQEIAAWCEHLAPLHVEHEEEEAARLAQELVERLVQSPRGRQLSQAAELHPEIEFLLSWPPNLHLRGYIDCLYRDPAGDWRLVDYKTNDVPAAAAASAAQPYEMQLYVYAMAAERWLGAAPAELTVYFLRPGVEHSFPWNEAARGRAIDMVDRAIQQLTQS
jgi:ATP-dependent helicase/nuclease subunit A